MSEKEVSIKSVVCDYCNQVIGIASNPLEALMLGWVHSFECPAKDCSEGDAS